MIAAIMQPYFFPYIGYFQLMHAVDVFVLHDDVQYIKSGWINRNRILVNGEPTWFTLPVEGASHASTICHRSYQLDSKTINRLKRRLEASYERAPMFSDVFPFLCDLLDYTESNVAMYNRNLLTLVAKKMGIRCDIRCSSKIDGLATLKAEDKVTALCASVGASTYINPIGGLSLYSASAFNESGIDLHFLRSKPTSYAQFSAPHVPYLSIIDVLMFNSTDRFADMLDQYESVKPETERPS